MKEFCQKNYNDKIGTCNVTIRSHGCFLVSLCMLADIDPRQANKILREQGGYSNGCLIRSERAAELLNLNYGGRTRQKQNSVCIAETDHFKKIGIPQHFFVWLGNGRIIDPLTGQEKNNPYKIVSYRLFKPKENDMKLKEKLEQALRCISRCRTGQNQKGEVDYIRKEFVNTNRSIEDYAQNVIRDERIPRLWQATTGEKTCPKSEIDFWQKYFFDHPDKEFKDLAGTWYHDHVEPLKKANLGLTMENGKLSAERNKLRKELDKTNNDNNDLQTRIKELKDSKLYKENVKLKEELKKKPKVIYKRRKITIGEFASALWDMIKKVKI